MAFLPTGGTQQFQANVIRQQGDLTVNWSIQEGSAGGEVTSLGLYTAPAAPGTFHLIAAAAADPTKSASATVTVGQPMAGFAPVGNMNRILGVHTATLLANGQVLMVGGSQGYTEDFEQAGQRDAELYDPVAKRFTTTVNMTSPRDFHTATLLQNGKVLVAGGLGVGLDQPPAQSSAELFDPAALSFTAIGEMSIPRVAHTATPLEDGRVLIAGGGASGGFGFPAFDPATATAELYDPAANKFISAGTMGAPRYAHTATALGNGQVLVVGGFSSVPIPGSVSTALTSAEIYDPVTGKFVPTGKMGSPRGGHTATLLPDGKVLIAGGLSAVSPLSSPCSGSTPTVVSATAELYDPVTGTFNPTGHMTVAREEHTATLLADGKVLIVGGNSAQDGTLDSAEIYDPATGVFTALGSMGVPRSAHTAILLSDGSVLIAGGNAAGGRMDMLCLLALGSAEVFAEPH
ncbi:MAG: hypothetical protein JOZ10_09455 [Acidobacteria bacterium]|nr:hypothetical protein [Acidobacteriota bacterium]